jgi:V8-like Glu-specific endopeptidase
MGMYSNHRSFFLAGLVITFLVTTLSASNDSLIPVVKYGEYGTYINLEPNNDSSSEKKIINENNLISVYSDGTNIPQKYHNIIDAFGNISMGCTATHIGGGVAITAGHCFRASDSAARQELCDKTFIHWGDRKDTNPYLESKCVKVITQNFTKGQVNLDYAFFKVDPAPEAKVEVDFTTDLKTGTSITIFGHPRARPLEWSGECTVQSYKNFSDSYRPTTNVITHQCDTEGGNSGSTIINTETMKVVAIHDGGISPWNYGTKLKSTVKSSHAKLERCLNNDGGASCFDQ